MSNQAIPNKKPNASMGQVRSSSRMGPDEGIARRRDQDEERARRNERAQLMRNLNRARRRK